MQTISTCRQEPAAQISHYLGLGMIRWSGGISNDDSTQLIVCRLSLKVLADPVLAASATLLFCFNPASAFFSAAYTEGLFASLTMAGLYYQASRPWTSAVSFAAASVTRSNGEHYQAGSVQFHCPDTHAELICFAAPVPVQLSCPMVILFLTCRCHLGRLCAAPLLEVGGAALES